MEDFTFRGKTRPLTLVKAQGGQGASHATVAKTKMLKNMKTSIIAKTSQVALPVIVDDPKKRTPTKGTPSKTPKETLSEPPKLSQKAKEDVNLL
ncbi:hypothetical protein RIF29_34500 [Crotalaria pallida]|uniref:Uncharacterized protein n=1 Tax=Crotalaria pallida TaxID=3830 RepID=A0AAN9E9A4_CROPI